jgi:hypothetical protein
LFKVDNMTRTKGKNTAEGNAFQKLLAEQEKKEKKKTAPKPKKTEKKPTPAGAVPPNAVKPKRTGAGTGSSILKQPQRLNTAAEIARQIAAQMETKGE